MNRYYKIFEDDGKDSHPYFMRKTYLEAVEVAKLLKKKAKKPIVIQLVTEKTVWYGGDIL